MLSLISCVKMSHFIKSNKKPPRCFKQSILHDLIWLAKRLFLAALWRIDWKGKVALQGQEGALARATLEMMVAGTEIMAKGVREVNRSQHEYYSFQSLLLN